jgi:hypothetical protein
MAIGTVVNDLWFLAEENYSAHVHALHEWLDSDEPAVRLLVLRHENVSPNC